MAVAIGLMRGVIEPLGTTLTTLPATTAADAPRAGASFAFYRSIDYLPHRDAAWIVFAERLAEMASLAKQLQLDGVGTTIESLLSRFTDAQDRRVRPHPPSSIPGAPG